MNWRNLLAVLAVLIIAGSIIYLEKLKSPAAPNLSPNASSTESSSAEIPLQESSSTASSTVPSSKEIAQKALQFPRALELTNPSGFLNTQGPITIKELIGKKVILIDFWTYSCINCQRTAPYLNAWHEKYKDQGLEIIGVHTPEFEFEKKYENVRAAIQKFAIRYPVVQDNDYGTWSAYKNLYWPRKYLIDIDGYIVYDHIGEGGYEETEKKIQELLRERMTRLGGNGSIAGGAVDPRNVPEVIPYRVESPEVYFGAWRNSLLGNGTPSVIGEQTLSNIATPETNKLYLVGKWDIQKEFAQSTGSGNKVVFKYRAKSVYMVASSKNKARVRVHVDGKPLSGNAGQDIQLQAKESYLNIQADQLYKLIEDKDYGEHTLEIFIDTPGVQLYTFTFG